MSTLHALACCAAMFALPVAIVWPPTVRRWWQRQPATSPGYDHCPPDAAHTCDECKRPESDEIYCGNCDCSYGCGS